MTPLAKIFQRVVWQRHNTMPIILFTVVLCEFGLSCFRLSKNKCVKKAKTIKENAYMQFARRPLFPHVHTVFFHSRELSHQTI